MKKAILLGFFISALVQLIFPQEIFAISYTPTWGPAGKLITVTGASFGNTKGEVLFVGDARTETAAIYSWADNQVVFQVPLSAPTRNFTIKVPGGAEYSGSYLTKSFSTTADLNANFPLVLNPDQGLGQCHAVDANGYGKAISWAYPPVGQVPWYKIEPTEGNFDWSQMEKVVALARTAGKKVWIQVGTTEGAIPDWVAGRVQSAGIRCDSRQVNVECAADPNRRHLGCDSRCSLDGLNHEPGTPIPWDEEYQKLLGKLIHSMAQQYDGDPNVEAILTMAGGCYGELSICNYQEGRPDRQQWIDAGYTNERFRDAAKQIIDLYLDETQGFLKTPIAEQMGMGLDPDRGSGIISGGVAQYANERYGMRVWFKQNGLGNHNCDENPDYGWLYRDYVGKTRVGYERGHWEACTICGITGFCGCDVLEKKYKAALNDASSFTCVSPSDLFACPIFAKYSKFFGAQIFLSNPLLQTNGNNSFSFSGNWKNMGDFPLIGQKRIGIKDVPVSYKLAFYFFRNGEIKGRVSTEPSWPTTNWFGTDIFATVNNFVAPAGLAAGSYDIKFSLEDEGRNDLRFKLVDGGYDLGNFSVTGYQCASNGGDSNGDGKVNSDDVAEWQREYLSSAPGSADFNCDEIIDEKDLAIITHNWKP